MTPDDIINLILANTDESPFSKKACYCKFCNNAMPKTGNLIYCPVRNANFRRASASSIRSCKYFEYNEKDVFSGY